MREDGSKERNEKGSKGGRNEVKQEGQRRRKGEKEMEKGVIGGDKRIGKGREEEEGGG